MKLKLKVVRTLTVEGYVEVEAPNVVAAFKKYYLPKDDTLIADDEIEWDYGSEISSYTVSIAKEGEDYEKG